MMYFRSLGCHAFAFCWHSSSLAGVLWIKSDILKTTQSSSPVEIQGQCAGVMSVIYSHTSVEPESLSVLAVDVQQSLPDNANENYTLYPCTTDGKVGYMNATPRSHSQQNWLLWQPLLFSQLLNLIMLVVITIVTWVIALCQTHVPLYVYSH